MALRYVQIVDALDFGDAVSNQVIRIHQMLLEKGEISQIFTKYADPRVENYRQHIFDLYMDDDTVILHHFSGYSETANIVMSLRCYKIMIYHNITPHTFFDKESQLYDFCKKGREQLKNIVFHYNLILGDSPFNCQEIKDLGINQVKELPIVVPNISDKFISEHKILALRSNADKVWLFVGRIAPNKRQDLLIDVFANYIKTYCEEKHHLYLVGKYYEDDPFYKKVNSKINELGLNQQVTLAGKVEDQDLPAYYQAANLFLCMSEHEGFCVPIVEAFNCELPVVAYADTAVADTMGASPGAVNSLGVEIAIQRIHSVFTNESLKNELIHHGLNQVKRFTPDAVRQHLYEIIDQVTARNEQKKPLQVSVVICTCDRSDYLQRCLNYLKDQDYPNFEVIVVNGPSRDNTMDILSDRKDLKVLQNPFRNLSISRNLGIQHASGDIVAFIDDDALPYDNWLSEIVKRYQEVPKNVVGIGGRTFFANKFVFQFESGTIDSFGNHLDIKRGDNRSNSSNSYRHLLGTNCSFKKDDLIAIHGFDEQYDYYLDETDLALRLQEAGGIIINANEAYVRHEFAQSHNRLGKYNFNWKVIAKNTVYFGIKNTNHISFIKKTLIIFNKVYQERCLSFLTAWRQEDIGFTDALHYSYNSIIGALRGCYDSCFPRRLGKNLTSTNSPFLPYLELYEKEISFAQSKLHILIISQEFPPSSFGGIGAYNQTLTRELMQMGHEVTVISRGSRDCIDVIGPLTHIQVASVEYSDCLPEYPILSKNLAWARKAAQIAKEVHKERPISVIESALWDFEGIGVLMLRPEFKIPLIVRLVTPLLVSIKMNGWEMTEDFKLCAEMEQEVIRCADAVIGISNSIKDSVVSAYNLTPDHRWLVQPLGVQPWPAYTNITNYGELPNDLKRGSIQILFVGRLESRKGIDIFLNALKLVMPKEPRLFVWIAGADVEGWTDKAKSILDKGLQNRVQFLGIVDEERRELLYANCDFLVFPSRYESFGLVPLESMVHGKPVIGAKAGAIPEVVLDGECGLLFEPDDYKDLAQKILTLIQDENLKIRLAKGAKQRVEVLSARKMAKASVEIYNSLTQSTSQIVTPNHSVIELYNNFVSKREERMKDQKVSSEPEINQEQTKSVSNINFNLQYLINARFQWNVKKPIIKTWGFFNSIFNGFIVPKLVKFINSVLHESMYKQNQINDLIINNFRRLEEEVTTIQKGNYTQNNNLEEEWYILKNKIESIEKSMNYEFAKIHQGIEVEKEKKTDEIITLKKIIDTVNKNLIEELSKIKPIMEEQNENVGKSLVEIKKLLFELQNLTVLENEMSRSEFAYRFKNHDDSSAIIINQDKLSANLDNLRINLGCGHIIMPDYINVDQRELPGVDVVANIANLPFEKNSVSEIFSSHVIEHFTDYEIINHILPHWYKLLKSNGKIVIICPDAKSMITEYANGNLPWENLRKVTYGAQDYAGNYHYNMYTTESLSQILSNCGFRNIDIVATKRINGLCYEMEIHAIK